MMVPVPDAPQVHKAGSGIDNQVQHPFRSFRDGDTPCKISPRTSGDESQTGPGSDRAILLHKAVNNLIKRSVTAHADDQFCTFKQGLPCKPCRVSRAAREKGPERANAISCKAPYPGPFPARGPHRCIWIDNESNPF